jgi:glycosyltransferase involved in cell wall biosynthesis
MDVNETVRVVMVVRLFHPWIGGTERQAHKLSKALIGRGIPARVVSGRWFPGTRRTEVVDGVPVFRHHTLWEFFGVRGLRKLGGYLYIVTLAWHLVRTRRDYDVIHVHGLNYHTAVAAFVGHRLGKPVVVKLANSGPASDIDRMRRGQQLAGSGRLLPAALGCDRFVALSPLIAEELRQAGVEDERITSIPNGVEIPEPSLRREPNQGPTRLVYVGRLHPQKGVDVLLDAVSLLTQRDIPVTLRIVGDGPERSVLEQEATRRDLAGTVEFVGAVDDADPELRRADVFVLPSRTEGMPNALLEAMARGMAVVATSVSGSSTLVEDGRTGLLVPPEDAEALAHGIERLVADGPERSRLGEGARAAMASTYALPVVASRYAALYRELTAPRSTPTSAATSGGRS